MAPPPLAPQHPARPPLRLWASIFLLYCSVYGLAAALPIVLSELVGSAGAVGLVMGLLAGAALVSRPVVGLISSRTPSAWLLRAGASLSAASFVPVLLAPHRVEAHVLSRLVQGLALACFSTTIYLYLDEIGGEDRRAHLISLFGLCANLAMASAPMAGSLLLTHVGALGVFAACALVAALSAAMVPTTRAARQGARATAIWDRRAVPSTLAMLGLAAAYGAMMVLTPLMAAHAHIPRPWLFFSSYGLTIIAARLATVRLLDRARLAFALGGAAGLLGALAVLSTATGSLHFVAAAVLFGLGVGMGHPSLMALVLGSVPPERRAAAATMGSLAFDSGIGFGPMLFGWVAENASWTTAFQSAMPVLLVSFLPLGIGAVLERSAETPRAG